MYTSIKGFLGNSNGKESACNAGDLCSIPESGRSPGEGHGNPLQYSYQENPTGRGAWQAIGYRVTKSQKRLKQLNMHPGKVSPAGCPWGHKL